MFRFLIVLVLALYVNALPRQLIENLKADVDLVVTLDHGGKIRGQQKSLSLREKYFSFKGIPYAAPPIGELRLRSPRPHPGWTDVRNATQHGGNCVGPGLVYGVTGVEDCLFLNVYTPPDLNPEEKYPVMFWIHGGSFASGSGNELVYGPELLVKQKVIVVTINYRLGFLGFFSTEDKFAQGNYGLKDCVEALKWVQNNIGAFGGNKKQVTIFGESAGGAIVHYLILSPMAKNLFHSAISQSGTALNPWSFQDKPKVQAIEAANRLNLTFSSTEDLVKQIREIEDPIVFAKVTTSTLQMEVPRTSYPLQFAPTVEPKDADETRFLSETPLKIMTKGNFNHVPYVCGATNEEGLFAIREASIDPKMLEILNNNTNLLLPYEWHIDPDSAAAQEIIKNINKIYFKGETEITDILDFVKYATDRSFEYAAYKTVELHAKAQAQPVFYYIFSFDGTLNYIKKVLLINSYDGAMHADDLGYLFKMGGVPAPILPGNPAGKVRERMVRMWTDFSKFATPTPEINELIPTKWTNVQSKHEYMDIGKELEGKTEPFSERMTMWRELDRKYNNAQ